MKFRILSHAGLEVSSGDHSILCDPWVLGSTYWRSWWNYPPCSDELIQQLKPDAIYLTHVHWDHFAAPSLRLFDPETLIVVPKEPAGRITRDLDDIGFHNYRELAFGESMNVGNIKITSYPFWIFTDSGVVIEADDTVLFNANDAKLMGLPLKHILSRHPKIDFVFRSHSSANSRVMYEFIDKTDESLENRETYVEDFIEFARSTGARYAVPFASNHCHLHKDVYHLNEYVVTPKEVEHAWHEQGVSSAEIKVMVSGDSWDSDQGFDISTQDVFRDRLDRIETYRDSVQHKLDDNYKKESNSRLPEKLVTRYFNGVFEAMPWIIRRHFKNNPILYVLDAGDEITLLEVDLFNRKTQFINEYTDDSHPMQIYTRTALFRHCMMSHLFSHLSISKRVSYRTTNANLFRLRKWGTFLNLYEYDMLPIRKALTVRFFKQWALRWREILLYGHIVLNLVTKKGFRYTRYLPKTTSEASIST